jgi:hypothetical protein
MQNQELFAYQKQLHKVRSFIDNGFVGIEDVDKLNELITGVSAELAIVSFEEPKESAKYANFVNDIIQQQVAINGILLRSSIKYSGFADRPESPASALELYTSIKKRENPTLEDLLVYFQLTLFENVYIFSTAEMNIYLKDKAAPNSDLTIVDNVFKPGAFQKLIQSIGPDYVDQENGTWLGEQNLTWLADILKDIKGKGYYREPKKIKESLIPLIAENYFHTTMSLASAKTRKGKGYNRNLIKIPTLH